MTYFDNSATSYPKPEVFYNNLTEKFRDIGVNASRGKYKKSSKMKQVENRLRTNLANNKFFNVSDVRKIIFTASCTLALNQVLQGLDYSSIRTVYISPFEHNAVYRTIIHLQKKYGFHLELIPFNRFIWEKNKTKLHFFSKKPDLVVLNHVSNVFGNILPVADIFTLAKEYDAVTVLDCAQSAGIVDVDMRKINADFACFAGHKGLYGPSGIGGFAINSDINLEPIFFGGTGINSEEIEMPTCLPERYEIGSMNSLGLIGLDLSVNWLCDLGIASVRQKKYENAQTLMSIMKEYDEITLISDNENIGVLSYVFTDYSPQDIAMLLNKEDISVRVGLHCAPLAHKHIRTIPLGTVRFSVGYFNTAEDFEKLDRVLYEIL